MKKESHLLKMIRIINEFEIGDVVTRQEFIYRLDDPTFRSVDHFRNMLCKSEYLKWVGWGKYEILMKIPEDLTYNQLVFRSYPSEKTAKKNAVRPEWELWWWSKQYGI